MKKLCIASVFGPSEYNPLWLWLQRHFLRQTTKNYDHVLFLDRCNTKLFNHCNVIGQKNKPSGITANGNNHLVGLEFFMDYFESNPYEYYLILDSDCFPFKEGWFDSLTQILQTKKKHFAAIMRSEIGEQYPHPSAIFIPQEHLVRENFNFKRGGKGVLNRISGKKDKDFGSRIITADNIWLPLIRTNKVNLHYVVAGLYGDIFYHHGAGTQKSVKRNSQYWKQVTGHRVKRKYINHLRKQLENDPDKFIARLRGY